MDMYIRDGLNLLQIYSRLICGVIDRHTQVAASNAVRSTVELASLCDSIERDGRHGTVLVKGEFS